MKQGNKLLTHLKLCGNFLNDVRSGDEALSIMENSINKIFGNSIQVNGIIQIINDIVAVISEIDKIAQKNSQAIEQITKSSKLLFEMVDKFYSNIKNYHDENIIALLY